MTYNVEALYQMLVTLKMQRDVFIDAGMFQSSEYVEMVRMLHSEAPAATLLAEVQPRLASLLHKYVPEEAISTSTYAVQPPKQPLNCEEAREISTPRNDAPQPATILEKLREELKYIPEQKQ